MSKFQVGDRVFNTTIRQCQRELREVMAVVLSALAPGKAGK